ncbi:MAG: hypothetical protein QW076_02465 [Candidatus Anstonellales archaeon]
MKKLRILFAYHKSVENYKSQLDDEIQLSQDWWNKIGVATEITKRDFDLPLSYQSFNNSAFKALSTDCQKQIAGKVADPGEFHIIYIVWQPTEPGSADVFTTYPWYKANGSVIICLPLTEEDAKRTDQWMWRAITHESVHAFFALLNLNSGMKLLDIQDTTYQEYRKIHPNPTEEELTNLSENIFDTWIKPHLDKLYNEPIEFQQATILKQLISLCTALIGFLTAPNTKKSVIQRLAEAIAQFEGFYKEGTVANRNNNPGNLVYSPYQSGQKDGFAYFKDTQTGWQALYYQLGLIFNGQSKYYRPDMTITEFVNTWASSSPYPERVSYAKYVASTFGVDINTKLNELK